MTWFLHATQNRKFQSWQNVFGAALLAISQFTLFADTSNGRRPTWQQAARGPQAEPLVDKVVQSLRDLGAQVETGKFGADMRISAVCDGPMTVTLEV